MKKFLVFILAILFAMPVMVQAQNKELEKQLKKEYKQKLKQLKKEGWQIYGTSRSLEVSLLLHYQKLNENGAQELLGTASNCVSMNVCRQMALQNACAYYASLAGSKLKGRIVSDLAANASGDLSAEFDKFYAAYERLVEKEIKGEIQASFSLLKKNANGSNELQTFFVINEDAATKAHIRAWENAARESEVAQKYAKEVSDFIKEGFDTAGE